MKDAKQFLVDYKEGEELRERFRAALNRLRADETMKPWQAVQKAALEQGYEVTDEEAKQFVLRVKADRENDSEELSDEEAQLAAGGSCGSHCSCDGSCATACY